MSEFIKKNKFLVHVASEVLCLCLIIMYIFKNNRGIYNHIQYLEQKLYTYETILEKHEQLLNKLLNKKVQFKEPVKTVQHHPSQTFRRQSVENHPSPPPSPPSPPKLDQKPPSSATGSLTAPASDPP